MLTAYYSRGCDSGKMFENLKISKSDFFKKHLNQYNVIRINMQNFLNESSNITEMINFIEEDLIDELKNAYPDIKYPRRQNLIKIAATIFLETNIPFVFSIDEWDCVLRNDKIDFDGQKISGFSVQYLQRSELR